MKRRKEEEKQGRKDRNKQTNKQTTEPTATPTATPIATAPPPLRQTARNPTGRPLRLFPSHALWHRCWVKALWPHPPKAAPPALAQAALQAVAPVAPRLQSLRRAQGTILRVELWESRRFSSDPQASWQARPGLGPQKWLQSPVTWCSHGEAVQTITVNHNQNLVSKGVYRLSNVRRNVRCKSQLRGPH